MISVQYMMNQVANSFKGVLGSYYDSGPMSDEQQKPQKRSKSSSTVSSISGSSSGGSTSTAADGSVAEDDSTAAPEFIMVEKNYAAQTTAETDSINKILSIVSENDSNQQEIELGVTFCPLPDRFTEDNSTLSSTAKDKAQ